MRFTGVLLWVSVFAFTGCGALPDPTPEPTAEGAVALVLRTQTRQFDSCDDALLAPVVFARHGDRAVFELAATREEVAIVWPIGFSARSTGGRADLVDTVGVVVAREGDVMDDIGGSGGDDAWNACSIGGRYYR